MRENKDRVRIVATADLHYGRLTTSLQPILSKAAELGEVLLLCGDLTDHGLAEEATQLAEQLKESQIPIVAVLGNHDYESGYEDDVKRILEDVGVRVLDGESCVVHGVGFGGTKGFAGGFGRATLEPWGEKAIKQFVQEAIDEMLKLESALARLRVEQRIALLHYSPVKSTVEGEPDEILAFLGSSRLEEPLNRYGVAAVFHGHAHRGRPEGQTQTGIPVYNVSQPVLHRAYPDEPPMRVFEVPVAATAEG